MAVVTMQWTLVFLIVSDIVLVCTTSKVIFYKKENFTGAKLETSSSADCQELPVEFQGVDGSIEATGCTTVYREKEKSGSCDMNGFISGKKEKRLSQLSLQYPFDKINDVYNARFTAYFFRECTVKESKPEIDVEFYDDSGKKQEFLDVCACTNLPSLNEMGKGKATSHGKCIKFYQTTDCDGVASHYVYTTVFNWYSTFQWKSMEPCNVPTSEGCKSTVHFFTEKNFKGVRKVVESSSLCQQLPDPLPSSVKTGGCIALFEDECVVNELFTGYIVKSKNEGLEELTRNYNPNAKGFRPFYFRTCSQMEIRQSHDFDFHETIEFDGNEERYEKMEFRDVCECKNLPNTFSAETRVQRIYTYGNCFKLYTNLNCDGMPSVTDGRLEISTADTALVFHSIEPCNVPKTCMRLKAFIFEMEPVLDKSEPVGKQIDILLATAQTFINNGLATIQQDYEGKKVLTETASFELSRGFREMSSIGYEAEFQSSFGVELPFVSAAITKMQTTFKHEWENDKAVEKQFLKNVSEAKIFAVSQKITIQPCSKYEASSLVRLVQNAIVDYIIKFEITARTHGRITATADEIIEAVEKQNNTFLSILKGHPKSTKYKVVAQSSAKLMATYGKTSMFVGNGGPISGCVSKYQNQIFF